jgi:AraC-like DNA-binding protein
VDPHHDQTSGPHAPVAVRDVQTCGDTLSDVLEAVKLTGALFFLVDASTPWVAEAPASTVLAPVILPRVQHVVSYHVVREGTCWCETAGQEPLRLEAGDVVVVPHGQEYALTSEPGLRAGFTAEQTLGWFRNMALGQLPFVVDEGGGGDHPNAQTTRVGDPGDHPNAQTTRVGDPGDHPNAQTTRVGDPGAGRIRVVCGFLGCDALPFNPVLATLPALLRVRLPLAGVDRLSMLIEFAVAESRDKPAGSRSVLLRLSELVFVEVVRRYLTTQTVDGAGWLGGLRDPVVGRALACLHAEPAHPWTVEELAREAAASRSVLTERFTHFVGHPPMLYLMRWRMQLAAGRLANRSAKVSAVARDVGYESEAAFSRAFKKLTGMAPALWRGRHM